MADVLEDAVEQLVKQLEVQCQPYITKGRLPDDARVVVLNIRDKRNLLRRKFSTLLEEMLLDEVVSETNFVVIHPEKTEAVLRPFWKELNQGDHHAVDLQIAKNLKSLLLLSGTFDVHVNEIQLHLRLFSVNNEDVYASLQVRLSRAHVPEEWLDPVPIYQNQKHLETAKAFIADEKWQFAQQSLRHVSRDSSLESVEARGLLIWIAARQGASVSKEFIAFKTLYPQHPLVLRIDHAQRKQALQRSLKTAFQHQKWRHARELLQQAGNVLDNSEQMIYEQLLEKEAAQWIKQILQQKNWHVLKEQWKILLQVFQSKKSLPIKALQQLITQDFVKEVHRLVDHKDRPAASMLLDQFGSAFAPDKQQHLRKAIAAIPTAPEKMMTLPSITFQMGNQTGHQHEQRVHSVFVEAFHIDQYEVSNKAYRGCVKARVCKPSLFDKDIRFNQNNQPVVGVSWKQAMQYCRWKNKRLPTEAEWERATEAVVSLEQHAWFRDNSGGRSRTIGTLQANSFKLFDTLGNAMEWVHDHFASDYYAWSPVKNPQGPPTGEFRVARGGSWHHSPQDTCHSCRFFWSPSLAFEFMGFRCAASLN
ncbi:MAG: SUMF1/EgtB/PvdO family nonheme iron enzyme [SAR324 cluster bacterium]|nr:SUMF1/EgtB/PvdO family nonheme iron enzyme [SAR324 cluster bacterium]